MFYDKERVKSAAKRRVKSGRRAHFILGSQGSNYNTVSADTFTGKQRDDQNVPAAGKVKYKTQIIKRGIAGYFSHMTNAAVEGLQP